MRPLPVLLCFFALALTPLAAPAQTFLSAQDRDFSAVIPPPPADDSPAGQADLDTLLLLQQDRIPEQTARARRVSTETPFTFAQPVLGSWFTSRNLPHTAAILEEIHHEIDTVVGPAKHAYHRPRPYARDPRIHPVVDTPGNDSYPSGHTANATVYAAILAATFPDQAALLAGRVRETMWGRQLGGVHYPTDTEADRILGAAVARRMLATPAMAPDPRRDPRRGCPGRRSRRVLSCGAPCPPPRPPLSLPFVPDGWLPAVPRATLVPRLRLEYLTGHYHPLLDYPRSSGVPSSSRRTNSPVFSS